jgi:hypothetical protein
MKMPAGRSNGGSGEPRPAVPFVEGALAFHREHGLVDVLAVVGSQRLIRVQTGPSPSEISVLAVHVGELAAVDRRGATGLPE